MTPTYFPPGVRVRGRDAVGAGWEALRRAAAFLATTLLETTPAHGHRPAVRRGPGARAVACPPSGDGAGHRFR